ncbi:MAG: YbaN family protein [Candidatus Bathyarchaeota archaeon]|nr:YbaN family protein [Candidatus Bathyarchaeota archaeon]
MQQPPSTKSKLVRAFFFVVGSISLALGVVGIVLPVLPTTPFLLLSLACYCRSSERMTRWVLNNKYFGDYIRRYKEGKGIPMKTKVTAITVLWATIAVSSFLLQILFVQVVLLVVAVAVTVHLAKLPTYHK